MLAMQSGGRVEGAATDRGGAGDADVVGGQGGGPVERERADALTPR
ncbi:MAG: hypothetical protein RL199_2008 [Pseudomonadota bacterium]|jgi:hypothetical protein